MAPYWSRHWSRHCLFIFVITLFYYIEPYLTGKFPSCSFLDILSGKVWFVLVSLFIYSFWTSCQLSGVELRLPTIYYICGSLPLLIRQSPLQQNKMNPMETGTQMDLAELSHSRPGNYSALLNDILASPAEVPSPLLASDDFPLPVSTTNWSIGQRFADLEAWLFERRENIQDS